MIYIFMSDVLMKTQEIECTFTIIRVSKLSDFVKLTKTLCRMWFTLLLEHFVTMSLAVPRACLQ